MCEQPRLSRLSCRAARQVPPACGAVAAGRGGCERQLCLRHLPHTGGALAAAARRAGSRRGFRAPLLGSLWRRQRRGHVLAGQVGGDSRAPAAERRRPVWLMQRGSASIAECSASPAEPLHHSPLASTPRSAATDRGRFSFMGGPGGPLWRRITYKLPQLAAPGAAAAVPGGEHMPACAASGHQPPQPGTLTETDSEGRQVSGRCLRMLRLGSLLVAAPWHGASCSPCYTRGSTSGEERSEA